MNVSLTPELVQYVTEKVESGLYASNSEVLREALRLLRYRERLRRRRLDAAAAGPEADRGEPGRVLTLDDLRARRDEILLIAAGHGAQNVRIFGSVARGDASSASDVDFLVEMKAGRTLLDRAGLLVDLQELLGCTVDVATEASLRQRVRQRALHEAVPL